MPTPRNNKLWGVSIYNKFKDDQTELEAWSTILSESIFWYRHKESLKDITNGSICYMTFLEYLRRDFSPHCPSTEYYGLVDNHVFFTPIKR